MSKVTQINVQNFNDVIKSGVTVVDFFATWCVPCRMLAPVLDELSEKLSGVKFAKVDIDANEPLAIFYDVNAVPNVCIFKDGELVDRMIGLQSADEMESTIKKHI